MNLCVWTELVLIYVWRGLILLENMQFYLLPVMWFIDDKINSLQKGFLANVR